MTNNAETAAPRRRLDPWETGQILDHFVSGFEWTVPSQLDVVDFNYPDLFPEELHGQRMLVFSDALPLARVSAGVGLLEDFLKLESASDDAILAYARRWGPLWLCARHRLPFRHDAECAACVSGWVPNDDAPQSDLHNDPVGPDGLADDTYSIWYCELLPGWRSLSRQARAVVRIARRLHDGRSGDQNDWDALPVSEALIKLFIPTNTEPFMTLDDVPFPEEMEELILARANSRATLDEGEIVDPPPDPSSRHLSERYLRRLEELGRSRMAASMDFQRHVLGEVLNNWLEMAGVRPRLDWSRSKPTVQLGGHGLIGALAVQLLFDCSRTDGLVVCTSCGTPFLPGPRRPRRDRNIYCSDCGIKAATRDASARYRQTERYRRTYSQYVQRRAGQ